MNNVNIIQFTILRNHLKDLNFDKFLVNNYYLTLNKYLLNNVTVAYLK